MFKCPKCGREFDRVKDAQAARGIRCFCDRQSTLVESKGPGVELTRLFSSLGIPEKAGCSCKAIAAEMNNAGPSGCRQKREYFLTKLKGNAKLYSAWEKFTVGKAALASGVPLTLGGLFDLAIERASSQS